MRINYVKSEIRTRLLTNKIPLEFHRSVSRFHLWDISIILLRRALVELGQRSLRKAWIKTTMIHKEACSPRMGIMMISSRMI